MGNTPNVITEAITAGESTATFHARSLLPLGGTIGQVLLAEKSGAGAVTLADAKKGVLPPEVLNLFDDMVTDYVARMQNLGGGITVESHGAVGDGVTDDSAAFQSAIDAAEAAGGGVVIVGLKSYRIEASLSIGVNVVLRGFGQGSQLVSRMPNSTTACIQFETNGHATVENLAILGDGSNFPTSPVGIGVSFSGSTFNALRGVHVWDHEIGVDLSDGVTQFSGYNLISGCRVNRSSSIGIRAHQYANSCVIENTRIFWTFDGSNGGVALSVDRAVALACIGMNFESFDLGLRLQATAANRLIFSLVSGYFEAGSNGAPGTDRRLYDFTGLDLGNTHTQVFGTGIRSSAPASYQPDIPTSANFQWDTFDDLYFGARRNPAAAGGSNMAENGDLLAMTANSAPNWVFSGFTAVRNTTDFETNGQSVSCTQAGTANDYAQVTIRCPEDIDQVSATLRYRIPSSGGTTAAQITLAGGSASGNTSLRAAADDQWHTATITVVRDKAGDGGLMTFRVQVDSTASGGEILIDSGYAHGGIIAPSPSQHAHRVVMLPEPQQVYTNTSSSNFSTALDPSTFTNLAKMPLGAVGMVLAVHGLPAVLGGEAEGDVLANGPYVYANAPGSALQNKCMCTVAGVHATQQVHVRLNGTTVTVGAIRYGATRDITLTVDLVGWILGH